MSKESIHVSEPLTSRNIANILDENPNLKKITCPISLYNRASPKYISVLAELGIEVQGLSKRGRPKKFKNQEIQKVHKLFKKGYTPENISKNLKIPIKSVYYIKKYYLTDLPKFKTGKSSKYNSDLRLKIKKMRKNNISAKEISEKENIPLRSVYNILNSV